MNLQVEIYCPLCNDPIPVPVNIKSVDLINDKEVTWDGRYYSYTRITTVFAAVSTRHTCKPKPDTDGLKPIERFIKNGALDDQGSVARYSNRR